MREKQFLKPCALMAAMVCLPLAARASAYSYNVVVNTTSALASSGYIDFQFNPSATGSQAATVQITGFSGDGVLNPADPNSGSIGNASGALPGTLTIGNGQTTNEYTEALTFGTALTFHVTLSGPATKQPDGTGGGTFTLDFLNSDQSAYLFTADPVNDVPVLTIDVNSDGTTTPTTYPSGSGSPVVSFASTPEPSSFVMICSTITVIAAAVVVSRRRRRK